MEEEYEEYGDPNQFEEFSGDLDINYVKEFAVLLGMHPIRDQRLLWWAEEKFRDCGLPGWLLVKNYKQELCWVNEELMQVEKLPPNLNELKTEFLELRKEYVKLVNSGLSADEASRPEVLFREALQYSQHEEYIEPHGNRGNQGVFRYDTANKPSKKDSDMPNINSATVGRQMVEPGSDGQGRYLQSGVNQVSHSGTNQRINHPGNLEVPFSAGRHSGNTGSGRFTEPRQTEDESNKKLDPRQALFASASASMNSSGQKKPRQHTPRAPQAVAIDEDYNDDPDELFEYGTNYDGQVVQNRIQNIDHDQAFELEGEILDEDEAMYTDGYEEHEFDDPVAADEERAVAYKISQDDLDEYIASEKESKTNMRESKTNMRESDFRDQGSRNLRSSRAPANDSLKRSSATNQTINDPIYLQLRTELDAIKKKINHLEGEHVELKNINSQLMTRSEGATSNGQGGGLQIQSQHSSKDRLGFQAGNSSVSQDAGSTQQQIEQELLEIKQLIHSSLRQQSSNQVQGSLVQSRQQEVDSPAQRNILQNQSQNLTTDAAKNNPHQAFYFNSAFSLGAPTAYLSPGDPLTDTLNSPQALAHIQGADLISSNAYPPNPYLKQSGQSLQSSGASNPRPPTASQHLPPPHPQPHHSPSPSNPKPPNNIPQQLPSQPQTPNPAHTRTPSALLNPQTGQHPPSSTVLPNSLPKPSAMSHKYHPSHSEGSSLTSSGDASVHSADKRNTLLLGMSDRHSKQQLGRGLTASGLALYHKWRDVVRGEWKVLQEEGHKIFRENQVVKDRKKGIREMEWEVLSILGDGKVGNSGTGVPTESIGVSRFTDSMIEGLRHAVFHYELDIEKLALLNEILNSRAKKLRDIEKSLKISLKSGRMDAMADDYLTLIFYQYIELCNLYESKWRIDTSRLVPYKKVNRSSMAPTKASQGALYPVFYKTELINGSGGFGEGSTPNNRQVFDETMSHFDFLKESLEKLREGTLLPGEAVKVYSDIGVFFENQQVWFSKIKQEIKVVIRRLNNPINLSALRNA